MKNTLLAVTCLILANLLSCGGKKTSPAQASSSENISFDASPKEGITWTLTPGTLGKESSRSKQITPATKISDQEATSLLNRVPSLNLREGDKKTFALPPRSLPAPRPGETIKNAFTPTQKERPQTQEKNEKTKELKVLRVSPKEEVPIAPQVTVTFSEPMIAVTSQSQANRTPVQMTPSVEGRWRWLGTRTLIFDPTVRMPQATVYKLSIPAGTKSVNGETLAKNYDWSFTTPTPRLLSSFPHGNSVKLNPVFFAEFDQKIDSGKVFEFTKVVAKGIPVQIRKATQQEIDADPYVKSRVKNLRKNAKGDRFVAFVASSSLPKGASVTVDFQKGMPSAEGPRTTQNSQSFYFETFHPLHIEDHRCRWKKPRHKECDPTRSFNIRFNNQLDAEAFDPKSITISPPIEDPAIRMSYTSISIAGTKKGNTKYSITIPSTLLDEHEQTLGKTETVTFTTGPFRPQLDGHGGVITLDPFAPPAYNLHYVNQDKLDIRLHQVTPNDFKAWKHFIRNSYNRKTKTFVNPPGKEVFRKTVSMPAAKDELAKYEIDLKPYLKNDLGHIIVDIRGQEREKYSWPPRILAWVQRTQLGAQMMHDQDGALVRISNLKDGATIQGAQVQFSNGHTSSIPGGEKHIERSSLKSMDWDSFAIVTKGADTLVVPNANFRHYQPGRSRAVWMATDRGLYKPGETVQFKGWMRLIDYGKGGDVELQKKQELRYYVRGPRGNKIKEGTTKTSALGGFDFQIELPKNINLGTAYVSINGGGSGTFQIQEFRRPEYEVTVKADKGPVTMGQTTQLTAKASYFAGGGLTDAPVNWTVNTSPGSYKPPKWDAYNFGVWRPWWWDWHWRPAPENKISETKNVQGRTDASGTHLVDLSVTGINPAQPVQVSANAAITDVNRQTWAGNASLLIHPSAVYAGIKTDRYFYKKGAPMKIQAIAVDHDGNAVAGRPMQITATRMIWKFKNGKNTQVEEEQKKCEITSKKSPVECALKLSVGGQYRVRVDVTDELGRPNRSELTRWIAGGKAPELAKRVELEKVELIPNKETFAPGETAEILVQSPFKKGFGQLSLRRSGVVSVQNFSVNNYTATLSIPVTDAYTPNLFAHVEIVGQAPRGKEGAAPRPAHASGELQLKVPPKHRELTVKVSPQSKWAVPGQKTAVSINVQHQGKPVAGAEIALIAVDESVWSLIGYQISNPLGSFYPGRGAGASDLRSRSLLLLSEKATSPNDADRNEGKLGRAIGGAPGAMADSMVVMEAEEDASGFAQPSAPPAPKRSRAMSKSKKDSRQQAQGNKGPAIKLRTNFDALAHFAPEVKTKSDGSATVHFKLPDNLTRYRIVALAVDGGKYFGKGESNITARLPLMVRPSAPRFLNFGDHFQFPVVVQNQTDKAMAVKVALRATNSTLTDGMGRKVNVPANDRVEITLPVSAEMAGTARFQIVAQSGSYSDAKEISLPVWTPATTEAFATYGELDKGAVRYTLATPDDAVKQFGGLEITTSSTQLQALTDAFLYLVRYPYECAEQRASRILSIAALQDVLKAFKTKDFPSEEKLKSFVETDLRVLASLQNHDGGFSFWRRGLRSWPWVSLHVLHAYARAESKGYKIPANAYTKAKNYAKNIERHIPSTYSEWARNAIIAYSIYVRHQYGDTDIAKAKTTLRKIGLKKGSLESIGFLYVALSSKKEGRGEADRIYAYLNNNVTETSGNAHFVTGYSDGAHLILHSSRRVDGILLEGLMNHKPKSYLISKLVRGLLAHKKKGRWANTQENLFILLALDKYFRTYEKVTPNFVANMWLGKHYVGGHKFKGRQTKREHLDVPMNWIKEKNPEDVLVQKKGAGRLYYRIGMNYAPKSLVLDPADYGFAVERTYEAVDNPGDVKRDENGVWQIKAGARVKVKLTMAAESRRYHVALVDPMPAGFEALNPAFSNTEALPETNNSSVGVGAPWWRWWNRWYEHQNMRDDRVEAFASLLWAGVYEYSYFARATTPGTFVVPPTKAEEMYAPETFGRAGSERVVIR